MPERHAKAADFNRAEPDRIVVRDSVVANSSRRTHWRSSISCQIFHLHQASQPPRSVWRTHQTGREVPWPPAPHCNIWISTGKRLHGVHRLPESQRENTFPSTSRRNKYAPWCPAMSLSFGKTVRARCSWYATAFSLAAWPRHIRKITVNLFLL